MGASGATEVAHAAGATVGKHVVVDTRIEAQLNEALAAVSAAATTDARRTAASAMATIIKNAGPSAFASYDIAGKITTASNAKETAPREGAAMVFAALADDKSFEPMLVSLLPVMLEMYADKEKSVRTAATVAATALVNNLSAFTVSVVLPLLIESMNNKKKWQTREGAVLMIGLLPAVAPVAVAWSLGDIVPPMTDAIGDARAEIRKAAEATLTACCKVVGNRDIEGFVPTLVSCIARPAEVQSAIHKLAATTFVQAVEMPALSMIVPLLARGLVERVTAIKRQTSIIIDNMCKLVPEPKHAAPFLPKLLPGLERTKEEVADPECRNVASRAYHTLKRAGGAEEGVHAIEVKQMTSEEVAAALVAAMGAHHAAVDPAVIAYIGAAGFELASRRNFEVAEWNKSVVPFLTAWIGEKEASAVAKSFFEKCVEVDNTNAAAAYEDDEGEDLCNCEFSLAYGGKILLNSARLRLKRGRRYALLGPNGAGKSTLMKAIANGQLEGFPPADELRTVYVEHDIQAEMADFAVVEFVVNDPHFANTSRDEIVTTLSSVGFTEEMQNAPVTSLSGGWRMKLALARAMLRHAEIMLLDEPTNHLDKINVAWLKNYLKNLQGVTCMIVSHDSAFIDEVCQSCVHYEGFKLRTYKGNLSELVKIRPEAKSYYSLADTQLKFSFPEPGYLEGVKTKDKAILKMQRVGFTYPGTTRKVLNNITIYCSLSSRVVVVGANGAGKSTMIKLLTGELTADEGLVWKHPNLRVAYVAQHAFHHLEQHLDKTPSEYIQWRYASGEDREALEKEANKVTEEEEKKMAEKVSVGGLKLVVEQLLARRKLKNSYEYEVQWVGQPMDKNTWLPRRTLEELGFGKMVDAIDAREAAAAGLHSKPLTGANIQKHLEQIGLEAEFALHSRMRGLSGGQKVKVVLGAAMWQNPHMLVLDEPTNYLDRDSLGALASAIKEFGGGVVMITHHHEFTQALCSETWLVADGTLTSDGASWANSAKVERKEEADEYVDAMGNVVKVVKKVKLTGKELRKKMKERMERRRRGEEVSDDEDEE